ncbi:acyl-CoA dehydrogenase family protein [Streptomyces sp. KLOTTS4A1]|uniref:acyl-CoA dehydrogenase family protein n=1 Tax=Streptomyces sp. KLOTTS4A1 TaxID=3390996 RepID=UPI0039F4809B
MDAAFTAEQDEIRRTLRELMAERAGPEENEAAVWTPAGHDPELWRALVARLGLQGKGAEGGGGPKGSPRTPGTSCAPCTPTGLALAGEETGRVLLSSPLLATAALALPLIRRLGGEEQCGELLPKIAEGALTAALAVPGVALATALGLAGDSRGDWSGGGRAGGVQARRDEEVWRLYGQAEQVLDGHSADVLLVAAHTGGFARSRTLLFLVRARSAGVVRVRQATLDESRPQARIELRDAQAELLGPDDAAAVAEALARTGDAAAVVLAAEAVGAADRALERTVEHARRQEQFGRAIGSFPSVRQRLADVYVAVQAARSAVHYAAWAAERGEDGALPARAEPGAWGRGGGLALAQALDALRTAAGEAVQLHGGIGSVWEYEAHRYFKRAAGDELLFGPVHRLRAHAADHAGLFVAEGVAV